MCEMSVIIITPDDYSTIRRLVECLARQTARDKLEIVIVAPAVDRLEPDREMLGNFRAVRYVSGGDMRSSAVARAMGIREASASVVVLTEDHSLPDPMWAETLIRAHRDKWAVVGPAVANGNPSSLTSWANLLIEYSEWLDPVSSQVVFHLPGHNSSYKRDILMAYGEELALWLESESVLHWSLAAKGHRLYIQGSAITRHLNYSLFLKSLSLRFYAGRHFSGLRARSWSVFRRTLYIFGSPLLPLVRFRRILHELCRPGRPRHLIPRLVVILLFFLTIDAIGQFTGYTIGPGDTMQRITEIDFHRERYMNVHDRRELKEG